MVSIKSKSRRPQIGVCATRLCLSAFPRARTIWRLTILRYRDVLSNGGLGVLGAGCLRLRLAYNSQVRFVC